MTTTELPKKKRGKPKGDTSLPIYNLTGTKGDQLAQINSMWVGCNKCELSISRVGDDICFGEGNPNADVLIIGESPGEEEDRTGVPFTGPSGILLNKILANISDDPEIRGLCEWAARAPQSAANLKRFNDSVLEWRHREFFLTNAVACRPADNTRPSNPALKTCWERVWNIIQVVDPLLIFVVGSLPAATVMKRPVEVTKVRGQLFDVTYQGRIGNVTYPVIPVLHPSYLLRKADWKVKGGDYEKTIEDWRRGMRTVDFLRNTHRGIPIPKR